MKRDTRFKSISDRVLMKRMRWFLQSFRKGESNNSVLLTSVFLGEIVRDSIKIHLDTKVKSFELTKNNLRQPTLELIDQQRERKDRQRFKFTDENFKRTRIKARMIIILSPKEGREKKWNEARVSIHRPSTPTNIRRSSYKFIKHSRRVLAEHAACVTNGRECISRRKNMQLYGVQSRHQVLFIGAAAYESGAPNLRVCIYRRTQLATIIYQGRGGGGGGGVTIALEPIKVTPRNVSNFLPRSSSFFPSFRRVFGKIALTVPPEIYDFRFAFITPPPPPQLAWNFPFSRRRRPPISKREKIFLLA